MNKRNIGKFGEELASKYFQNLGYNIVAHNFHTRYGEIDLILRKDNLYRFVEVKFRSKLDYGLPQESVIKNKQEKIKKATLYWLRLHHLPLDTEIHFDVLAITRRGTKIEYEHLKDAF
ncbi:MAG: YraN family protein [candidate division WOR-3 bacterium]